MKRIVSCELNMDTGCVETKYDDGSMIAINCSCVESEFEVNTIQQSELDWLIFNEPYTYVNLILSDEIETYLKGSAEHKLQN